MKSWVWAMPRTTTLFSNAVNARAVANAVLSIRQLAAFMTRGGAGRGVAELADELVADAVVLYPSSSKAPFSLNVIPPSRDQIRHRRKHAEGNMRYHSFIFASRVTGTISGFRTWRFFPKSPRVPTKRPGCITCSGAIAHDGFVMPSRTAALRTRLSASSKAHPQSGETRNLVRNLIEIRYALPE